MGERRGTQPFDNPAFQRNASIEDFAQVRKSSRDFWRHRAQVHFQAGHIKLGCHQQCTEFIMKFAGEVRTFLLSGPLQMGREVF